MATCEANSMLEQQDTPALTPKSWLNPFLYAFGTSRAAAPSLNTRWIVVKWLGLHIPHWRASGFLADFCPRYIRTEFSLIFPARCNETVSLLAKASELGRPGWVQHPSLPCGSPCTRGVSPGVGLGPLFHFSVFPTGLDWVFNFLSCPISPAMFLKFDCYPLCLQPWCGPERPRTQNLPNSPSLSNLTIVWRVKSHLLTSHFGYILIGSPQNRYNFIAYCCIMVEWLR